MKKFVIYTTIMALFVFPDVDANICLNVMTDKFVEDITFLKNRSIAKPHKNAAKIILVVNMRNVEIMYVHHLKTVILTKIVQAKNVSRNSEFVLSLSSAIHRMTVSLPSFVMIILFVKKEHVILIAIALVVRKNVVKTRDVWRLRFAKEMMVCNFLLVPQC